MLTHKIDTRRHTSHAQTSLCALVPHTRAQACPAPAQLGLGLQWEQASDFSRPQLCLGLWGPLSLEWKHGSPQGVSRQGVESFLLAVLRKQISWKEGSGRRPSHLPIWTLRAMC